MNWSASSTAAWLTLSAASGTTPGSLTVTADPTGIPDGSDLSAKILVTASGQPTITLPATLVVGSLMDKGIAYKPKLVYLPLVLKQD